MAYADGTADVDVQRRVERHLARCRICTTAVDELRVTTLLMEIAGLDRHVHPARGSEQEPHASDV